MSCEISRLRRPKFDQFSQIAANPNCHRLNQAAALPVMNALWSFGGLSDGD